MPKGVEHSVVLGLVMLIPEVNGSEMPKGVEHGYAGIVGEFEFL